MTTLGLLKAQHDRGWQYLEFWYRKCIKKCPAEDWAFIGQGDDAMQKWIDIFVLLAVDLKAHMNGG